MALKHRKLFPALSATNQSADCADFYNCSPYADYYFLPPPLHPPPPPPPSLLPPEHHISPYVIIIVSLLVSFFLLVSYYVIIAKSFPSWLGSRNNRQAQGEADGSDEEFVDEDQVDQPIWFITTAGLQQSIINSITVCKYKKGEGLIEGAECSVCLSEFQQDETLRLLPKCNHAFHIPCIDTWLRSHTNCPLCRAHIVSDSVISPLPTANQNPEILNTISSTYMENLETDGELGNNQERNEHCENRAGTEEGDETVLNGHETPSKEDVNPTENGYLEIICESGNDYQGAKSDIQSMRRSVSLDSLTAATMCLSLNNNNPVELVNHTEENAEQHHPQVVLKQEESRNISTFKQMGSWTITEHLHKSPVPMKRSFSCGGRFFSSRQNRNLNLILPL